MKLLIALIIGLLPIISAEELVWSKLSEQQKQTARYIYKIGSQYDLGATLVAIAWQESRLGLYPVNMQDPSCGAFHQILPNYIRQHNLKDTPLTRNIVCGNLINNLDLATLQAVEVLLFFKKYHTTRKNYPVYPNMVKSYNAGFKTNIQKAETYYKQVYHNVKILESIKEELRK